MDEATSALDNRVEEKIMKGIMKKKKNLTILIIAHRLTTLKDCDYIVHLDKNHEPNIVTYEGLLDNEGSLWKCLEKNKLININVDYKLAGIKHNHPEMIILGSSRVMQIRDEYISSVSIYNASLPASTGGGLKNMLKIISEANPKPKYIIIGLDPWLFRSKYPENLRKSTASVRIKRILKSYIFTDFLLNIYFSVRSHLRIISNFLKDAHNLPLSVFFANNGKIGLNSALYNSGYEIDGSYLEPQSSILNWKDESVNEYIKSLGRDNYRFPSFGAIDST